MIFVATYVSLVGKFQIEGTNSTVEAFQELDSITGDYVKKGATTAVLLAKL